MRLRQQMTIEQVQRWVVSFLILAVALFPLGALFAVIATIVDSGRRSDGLLLLAVMAALGVLALGAIRLVHGRFVLHPVLILGLVPAIVTAVIVL